MEIGRKYLWLGGLLQLVVLLSSYQQSALANPDGINFYKDWIRNKNEDEDYAAMLSEEEFSEPKLFFYRTPVSPLIDYNLHYSFDKRTFNKYKNMMINKDAPEVLLTEDREEPSKAMSRFSFPRITPKRSPGAILSWAIPAANRVRVIPNSYRPPAINRPAA
ncbi:AAEL007493-PA [Aedes aegypti]|uniref:AAEL007493-PA n=1 Tax=Aedes aegypti TaxID=7159 RepID=Q171Z4_AEDAE|nr:AAEL007493-PA [Aedes aegypti]